MMSSAIYLTSISWSANKANLRHLIAATGQNGILADMPTFALTKRIFLDSQFLSHWYHLKVQLMGNKIWKKIDIRLNKFLVILICIYQSKLLVIRFSSNVTRHTKSPPQSHLVLRKYSSTRSCLMCYLKALTVGLSIATMYGNVHIFLLVAMAMIQITHFDQLGTICKDYQEEYPITGA